MLIAWGESRMTTGETIMVHADELFPACIAAASPLRAVVLLRVSPDLTRCTVDRLPPQEGFFALRSSAYLVDPSEDESLTGRLMGLKYFAADFDFETQASELANQLHERFSDHGGE